MNTYEMLVAPHRTVLETNKIWKVVSEIAALLDNPIFAYQRDTGKKKDAYSIHRVAVVREPMYHTLCAYLVEVGIPLPPLEPEFYESCFPDRTEKEDQEESVRIKGHVEVQHVPPYSVAASVAQIMEVFPSCCGWHTLDKETLVALLNADLIKRGLEPVRPDYKKWKKGAALKQNGPKRPIRIVVVDDSLEDLGKTMLAIAGWENAESIPFYYQRREGKKPSDTEKEELMQKTAEEVLVLQPDVVLMDEGLIDFDGSALIPVINGLAKRTSRTLPVFVANTGGSDETQRNVGAFPNCDKGKKLSGIAQAISSLE